MSKLTPMHTDTTYEKVNSGTWAVTHPADFRHGRGGRLLTLNNNMLHTPQNAQQATYALPELPTWRPRDGRNDHHIKWLDALTSMEADLDIVIDCKEPTDQELQYARIASSHQQPAGCLLIVRA